MVWHLEFFVFGIGIGAPLKLAVNASFKAGLVFLQGFLGYFAYPLGTDYAVSFNRPNVIDRHAERHRMMQSV